MVVFVSKFKGEEKLFTKIFTFPVFFHFDIKNGKIFLLGEDQRSESFENDGEFIYRSFFSFDNSSLFIQIERTEENELTDVFAFDNVTFFHEDAKHPKSYYISNSVKTESFVGSEGVEYSSVVNHQDSQYLF
jgi:hypothetical protein